MKYTFFFLIIFTCLQAFSQKVGLVFSGGGAKGLAHIGVLKALEENNIPIDYITGTSMGAVVGAMYSAGYSPQEIEYIALSEDFQNWVGGKYSSNYSYYFQKKETNPSFITAKLQIDTGFNLKLRSNLINDIPLNFALIELLSQASANARDNFDNLFIPFRCIVADVLSQKMIPVKKGNLAEAVRGSMTVPLVYRPIKVDDKFVFDGGLYNNFPVDVMKLDFEPGIIIGSNVSSKNFNSYPKDNDEKLMNRFLVYLFLSKTDSTAIGKNGVYIEPDLKNYTVTNFKPVKEIIEQGYKSTLAQIPEILKKINRRQQPSVLAAKRKAFNDKNPYLKFNSVNVTGVNSKKRSYVKNIFNYENKQLSLKEIKDGYYKLLGDDNFETIYPNLKYRENDNSYNFNVQIQSEDNLKLDFGGNISSRPISNAFIGLQYNYLHKLSYTFNTNFYLGRFYESAQGIIRIDFPFKTPFFLETNYTFNHWNYFSGGELFSENKNPTFIEQSDKKLGLSLGSYIGRNAKFNIFSYYIHNKDNYSPTDNFTTGDILDKSIFDGFVSGIRYSSNTLNKKQYANAGKQLNISLSYFSGIESYDPGNILKNNPDYELITKSRNERDWFKFNIQTEQYFKLGKKYALGYSAEAVYTNKPNFTTYKSNLLSTSVFYPLQDSKSLFIENLRADKFIGAGIKNVYSLRKNIDFRLEGHIFQPFKEVNLEGLQQTKFGDLFADRSFIGNAGFIYHTPVGPIGLNLNYYDNTPKKFGFLFHLGYLLYNKRSLEL